MAEGTLLVLFHMNSPNLDSATGKRLQSLSKIMLLFDSEHQMASNARKRLIQQKLLSADDELSFLNVIFTSPLPRHTKSPVLWFHRRFVLQHLTNRPSLQEEMDVIFKAGERHPKNYYAWTYARWGWETLWPESQWGLPQLAYGIRAWCMAHVGDISGWAFFLWFCGSERAWRENLERLDSPVKVVEKVVQMGRRVTPGHEAMWAFVRGCAIGMEGVLGGPDRVVVLEMVQEYLVGLEGKEGNEPEKQDFMTLKRYARMIEQLQTH
jgi:protein prenyltransferase alpha subunit repeat containing protein 1